MSKDFKSPFADDLYAYLRFKRSLGYLYVRAEATLQEFDRFVCRKVQKDCAPRLDRLILAWLASKQKRKAISVSRDTAVLRGFCNYLKRLPGRLPIQIPQWPQLPNEAEFRAFFLSKTDICHLLALAAQLQRPIFRAVLYRALLLVLYCTGVRFGEALRLRMADVDTQAKVLFVRHFKRRARWVPFKRSLSRELEGYLKARRIFASALPDDYFFVGANKLTLSSNTASETIRGLFRKAGLKPKSGRIGPRPYDFRHAFAMHRLALWYRQGADLHSRLPWLSAYMGHDNILGTQTYLSATPELLHLPEIACGTDTSILLRRETTMTRQNTLMALVQSYFHSHLRNVRGASDHTLRAYGNALRLFFLFLAKREHRSMNNLGLDHVQAEAVLGFLDHIESARSNSRATRNCRLAAIRSFVQHLLRHDISRADQYGRILAISNKRSVPSPVSYLEPEEVRAIIAAVDSRKRNGARDRALLLLLYNTGARIGEALGILPHELRLDRPRQVMLHGKGGKDRYCPLWAETAAALRQILCHDDNDGVVFRNARGAPLSRDGAAYLIKKYVHHASKNLACLRGRNVTPHVFRHSCAVALLQAGVDVTVIRDYLGHASVSTTSRYLTTNLKMKRDVLTAFWNRADIEKRSAQPWRPSSGLLRFLESL